MDTNLSIIELVQRRPILYTRCNDFPGRAHQWKEVADILKTDVSFVKSRWHLLRSRFMTEYSSVLKGNRTTFKYLTEMSFLSNHINLEAFEKYSKENNQYSSEPEFNITIRDLEAASDDDSTSEFIELELDDESHRELAQIPFGSSEEVNQNVYVEPIYVDEYSNTSKPMEEDEGSSRNEDKQQQVELFIEVPASTAKCAEPASKTPTDTKDEQNTVLKDDVKYNKVKVKPEEKVPELDKICKTENISSTTNSKETLPNSVDKPISSPKTDNLRCEDTIFGELVTATLRQMQTDKKKAVKREIMNLLFT
ncbi:uncharacterized protein LOC129946226 [Eupeodes corollae]|uniref:uncharacterized protein LOC129946226 n=1 Tax=Eupeodes corollae TaxID=290404 RepID=UPI002491571B|nr:uncharacterized protein LOC129946226 [Eupeodes corollae]